MWIKFFFVGNDLQDEAPLLCTEDAIPERTEQTNAPVKTQKK